MDNEYTMRIVAGALHYSTYVNISQLGKNISSLSRLDLRVSAIVEIGQAASNP